MKCNKCGKNIRENLKFCTACGNEITKLKSDKKKTVFKHLKLLIPIAVLVAIIIIILIVLFGKKTDSNKGILAGVWYEYSPQDVFAYEWIFYDDGTCTRETRGEGGSNKSDTEYAIYSIDKNEVTIYEDGAESKWEYDPKEDCCWLYFVDEYGNYKFKITHYDDKLTQEELDKTFCKVSEYVVRVENNEDEDEDTTQNAGFSNVTNPIDLVKIWDNYSNMGFCCNSVDAPADIYEHLTEYQKQWVLNVYESTCCHTIDQAKIHIEHYIDSSLIQDFDERNFLEYNGKLYIVTGAKGYVGHNYEMSTWYKKSDGNIGIYSDRLTSGGELDGEDEFTVEIIDERYKIIDIKDNTVDLSKYY